MSSDESIHVRRGDTFEKHQEASDEAAAQRLSQAPDVTTVWWSIHTAVDQIWIKAFTGGKCVRELRYSADEGWAVKRGKALPFEATGALKQWLKEKPSASPHGYDVLACFLGEHKPPMKVVVEPNANTEMYFHPAVLDEARALAARRSVTLSAVLYAGWQLGRLQLFERELPHAMEGADRTPPLPGDVPAIAHAPVDVTPLELRGEKVKLRLYWPPESFDELRRYLQLFDRPVSWLVQEAYSIARSRLL